MNISFSDIIGSIGVFILLLAFVLNLVNKISRENIIYILMNTVGAALACFASYLIHYIPFIILEAVWTLISLAALLKFYKNKKVISLSNKFPYVIKSDQSIYQLC